MMWPVVTQTFREENWETISQILTSEFITIRFLFETLVNHLTYHSGQIPLGP